MKYILKAALILTAVNTAFAGSVSFSGSISDYIETVKTAAANQKLGEVATNILNSSVEAFNQAKTQAMPYLVEAGNCLVEQANKAFTYATTDAIKNDGQAALAIIQTPAGKLVVVGTTAVLVTGYGLLKLCTTKSDRKK